MYFNNSSLPLDLSTTAPGWPNHTLGADGTANRRETPPIHCQGTMGQRRGAVTTPTTPQGK